MIFRFPLEKVLDWRRSELDLAELKFQQLTAAVAAVDRALAELETAASGRRSWCATGARCWPRMNTNQHE